MDESPETPTSLPPEAGAGPEKYSREKVVQAFNNAYSMMEADPSVDQRVKKSISEAREKTIDQGRSTFTNTFENHHTGKTYNQEEGIPVEDIRDFLENKIKVLQPNTPEWQKLINITHTLYRNSQPYFRLHHYEYPTADETSQFGSRVHQEAYFISQDERDTGDENSNWFKSIDTLNNRWELILPSLQPNIDEWGENGKPAGEEPILEEPSPDEVPKTETPPFFGIDIINYEEAISKEAHLEARKSVTEDLRRGKWYQFWHWPRKVGMRLIEPAMVNFRKERLREAMRSNNLAAGQLATLERFKEGRTFEGEKREEVQGNLKGLITDQILKPIIDGQITTPEQVQKLLADFVRKNLNDPQVRAVFGPGANDFGDVAQVFSTDVLEMGLSLKAYMEAHQKTLQQMDKQVGINLDYARLAHMTDTRNYVDKAVAWAKRRQSENLARGARGLGFSGVILNPAVVGVASALAVSGFMRSAGWAGRLAALPSFFIGGLAGGGVAGMRRYYELGWDRSQHAAERVSGAEKPDPKDKRREELEKRRYNIAPVDQLLNIDNLLRTLGKDVNETNQEAVARRMVEIQQRLDMSSLLKKDLIDYQSAEGKKTGANELTRAVVKLRTALQNSGADIQGLETRFKDEWSRVFTENIKEQDSKFQSYRLKESAKAAVFGGVVGMAAGFLGSEIFARVGNFFEAPKPPVVPPSVPDINTIRSMFPGVNAAVDANGHINVTGAIPPDAHAEMQRLSFTVNQGPDIQGIPQTIIEQKPVFGLDGAWTEHETNVHHREWYAYDRPGSQANELRQFNFKDGKSVILDLSKMEQGFQKGLNPNPINVQEVIRNGESGFYVTTPDTPQDGIWIPDSADGAIDGKVRLDPDDMAHMIKTPNGQISNGELANLLINQKELQNYGDGSLATELNQRFKVFNIGEGQRFGFIEAGRMQARPEGNILQVFATIRGLGPTPETIGVPIEVPGEPTPTFEIIPPPVPELVPETEETPFIIPIPFAPRHPLEPTSIYPPRRPPYYYGGEYPPEWVQQAREGFSPGLSRNPNYIPQPGVDIPWYIEQQRQHQEYFNQLENLEKQVSEPMSRNCEMVVCIAVAGHQEQSNIYRTLQTLEVQRDKDGRSVWDGDKYEVILLVNWSQGTSPQATLDEINRFKADYKARTGRDFPVRIYRHEVTNGFKELGLYKKMAFDLALLRRQQSAPGQEIYITMNDADMTYTNPRYLEGMLSVMKDPQYRQFDAILGRQDLDPEAYYQYPTFHAGMRFWQFMESIMRSKLGMIGTQGRNTAIRGSSYAAIGGNRTKDFFADIEFGDLLKLARNNHGSILYSNSNWVMVDPRRELNKFLSGEPIAETWFDFNTRNVRGTPINFGNYEDVDIDKLQNDRESIEKFNDRLEKELTRIVQIFGPKIASDSRLRAEYASRLGLDPSATAERIIERTLGLIGVEGRIDTSNQELQIILSNTEKLRRSLKTYQAQQLQNTKIRNNPLFVTQASPATPSPSTPPPTENLEVAVPQDAMQRRIQEIRQQAERIQQLQARREVNASPPFITGQGGKFVWQEVTVGQGASKKSDDLFRGYLMVEPENLSQAVDILLDVARRRRSQGKSTDFKWLMMTRSQNEDINDSQNIGKYTTLQPADPRIALYGDNPADVMEVLRDLARDPQWRVIEAGRINKYGGLPHTPRRPGTNSYIDERGVEWRSLNFNDEPGYSEEEAGFPDWRERKQGEPTIPVGPVPQPDLGDVLTQNS